MIDYVGSIARSIGRDDKAIDRGISHITMHKDDWTAAGHPVQCSRWPETDTDPSDGSATWALSVVLLQTSDIDRKLAHNMKRLITQIESLVGRPYVEPADIVTSGVGIIPDDGFDCLTLVAEVFRLGGVAFPMPESHTAAGIDAIVLEVWSKLWVEITDALRFLDVVHFTDREGNDHIGACIDGRRIIHCSKRWGVTINRLATLRPRMRGVYRLKELA
jgi:cell wall-associated NlpC family hydrolase